MKYTLSNIDYFLRNELKFLQRIEYHYQERSNCVNLGVQGNRYGNTAEYVFLKKITDENYLRAKLIVDSINQLRNECDDLEKDLLYYWAYLRKSYSQIRKQIGYSESTVKKKILKLRHRLVDIINDRSSSYE